MFDYDIAWGHRREAAGNPCSGIARYRRPPRGRLLGAVLRQLEGGCPVRVAAVRLVLLTECRPGEIRRLHWCEVRADKPAPSDAKTGPRHVLLGDAARKLLDSLADTASGDWVFPSDRRKEPLTKNEHYRFRTKADDTAGIVPDARLHDLRHTHASHAVMNGESLHVAGRLLGHRCASPTNRCVHLDDAILVKPPGELQRPSNKSRWSGRPLPTASRCAKRTRTRCAVRGQGERPWTTLASSASTFRREVSRCMGPRRTGCRRCAGSSLGGRCWVPSSGHTR